MILDFATLSYFATVLDGCPCDFCIPILEMNNDGSQLGCDEDVFAPETISLELNWHTKTF
jgi:hypothetical protein